MVERPSAGGIRKKMQTSQMKDTHRFAIDSRVKYVTGLQITRGIYLNDLRHLVEGYSFLDVLDKKGEVMEEDARCVVKQNAKQCAIHTRK
jgi:hypothetical protein